MSQLLSDYFKEPSLFKPAIQQYESEYIRNRRRDWSLTGQFGKLTAYTLSAQVFLDQASGQENRSALSKILEIVQSWNGDTHKPRELSKYGAPAEILDVLVSYGEQFRLGSLSLVDLKVSDYEPLCSYLRQLSIVKSHGNYAWIPISKFLHITNPSLFPIYDDRNVWYKLMAPSSSKPAGIFSREYSEFCYDPSQRGLPLSVSMKPIDWTFKFNANYVFWARKHVAEASPDLMPYFGDWFTQSLGNAPDPYGLKSQADKFYGLAFEAVALGAGCLEASRG